MKILTVKQIREWDQYTIDNEPIHSFQLMERAATMTWYEIREKWEEELRNNTPLHIFCGMGNNGGDGLVIGRLAKEEGRNVKIYVVFYSDTLSPDCDRNYRLLEESDSIIPIYNEDKLPEIESNAIIIDAIFGIGLSKSPDEITESVIKHLNHSGKTRIAIDVPSGLFADSPTPPGAILHAHYTYTFQVPKLAFFLSQNEVFVGEWKVLDIGLHPDYFEKVESNYYYLTEDFIRNQFRPRKKFSHKGNYGHVLIAAGSHGKIGAAVLAGKACIKTGAGLVTMMTPQCGYNILQTSAPELMVITDDHEQYLTFPNHLNLSQYNAIAIGPGLGTHPETQNFLREVFRQMMEENHPSVVLDADAINLIADNVETQKLLPDNAILTPHPRELERLTGKSKDDWYRLLDAQQYAKEHKVYIVLKGAHTAIICPDGNTYFNTTGNPGMATAGMGDVLTGIITGLLAQGHTPLQACITGVYWHGLAGDVYLKYYGEHETLTATDIILCLPKSLKELRNKNIFAL